MSKVWLVTGCSRGLGKTLVSVLLKEGYRVIATSRDKKSLENIFGLASSTFLPVSLNLINEDEINEVINLGISYFGSIDVLVNNAGYLQLGAVEEETDHDVRASFDINYFGALNMCRHVIPVMRNQGGGRILNTSSIAGFTVNNLGQTYSGTKFALNALSYALSNQVKYFNIHTTNLVLGYFRTDFLSADSMSLTNHHEGPYHKLFNKHLEVIKSRDHKQPGDPVKACYAYIKLAEMDNPPHEILLGSDSYDIVKNVLETKLKEIETLKDLTFSTDFELS